MKRTKESFFREHPEWQKTQGLSGLREFDGEDLQYDARNKYNKELQKQWIQQQIEEKRQKDAQEKAEEQAYAQQTLEINRFRGMLQDNFHQKKTDIGISTKQTNLLLVFLSQYSFHQAKEKKDKEEKERLEKLRYEQAEVQLLKERGQKQTYQG